MRGIIIGVFALLAAGVALAQPSGGQGGVDGAQLWRLVPGRLDANHDNRISRAEWLNLTQEMAADIADATNFDPYDRNRDGFIDGAETRGAVSRAVDLILIECDSDFDEVLRDPEELRCLAHYIPPSQRAQSPGAAPGHTTVAPNDAAAAQPHQPITQQQAQALVADALDANHDHRISRAEWSNLLGTEIGFDTHDTNRDGFISGAEEISRAMDFVLTDVVLSACDTNYDNVYSSAEELSCLAAYTGRNQPAPNAHTPPSQAAAPPPSGPAASLAINAAVRIPGPGRNFAPVANAPVYLSSRDLEQTLASAGLMRPTPVDAWLQACRAHAPTCQQGMDAIRGNDPGARGLTDAQGHFTFTHAPVGHFFVVSIGDITLGHTLIWCVPIDLHAGENELTLAGHNLYVSPDTPQG